EVLDLVQRAEPGPWKTVRGMVADLLTVRHEYAPLIDLALGELAQRFLVDDANVLQQAIRQHDGAFSGRVSFWPARSNSANPRTSTDDSQPNRSLELSNNLGANPPVSSEGAPVHPGVIALAAALVSCTDPELTHLPEQLLGRTLIVRDLEDAREVAGFTSGYRFITLQGEMLEPDGTLTVGTHHAETGILSRKSELRELRERSAEVDAKIQTAERELADLRDRIATADSRIEQAQREIDVLAEQAADLRSRIGQHRQRRDGLHEEVTLSRTEIIGIEVELQSLRTAWQEACSEAARCEARVQELQERLRQGDAELHDRERKRHAQQEEVTRAK